MNLYSKVIHVKVHELLIGLVYVARQDPADL